jgi:hypothetical protein
MTRSQNPRLVSVCSCLFDRGGERLQVVSEPADHGGSKTPPPKKVTLAEKKLTDAAFGSGSKSPRRASLLPTCCGRSQHHVRELAMRRGWRETSPAARSGRPDSYELRGLDGAHARPTAGARALLCVVPTELVRVEDAKDNAKAAYDTIKTLCIGAEPVRELKAQTRNRDYDRLVQGWRDCRNLHVASLHDRRCSVTWRTSGRPLENYCACCPVSIARWHPPLNPCLTSKPSPLKSSAATTRGGGERGPRHRQATPHVGVASTLQAWHPRRERQQLGR